jgi:hypothetical protein
MQLTEAWTDIRGLSANLRNAGVLFLFPEEDDSSHGLSNTESLADRTRIRFRTGRIGEDCANRTVFEGPAILE